jgi:hypothetical protein
MRNNIIKHIILISSIVACFGLLGSQAADYCYPMANIKTVSGKQVTLTNVSVYADAEGIKYVETMHQEITFIAYTERTSLGSDFEGKHESISLPPAYFREITFASNGDPQRLSFVNHADISAKDVIFTFPGDPKWSGDQWLFYGTAIDQGKEENVSIRGSKIDTITFKGVPVLIRDPARR